MRHLRLLIAAIAMTLVLGLFKPVHAQEIPQSMNLAIINVNQTFMWRVQDASGYYEFRATPIWKANDPNYPGMHVIGTGINYWDILRKTIYVDIYVNIGSAETNLYPSFLAVSSPPGVFLSAKMSNKYGPYYLTFLPLLQK